MPPIDGTTIGVILAGIVSLVTALGTVQTRRDTSRKKEIAELRAETARMRATQVATVRWIYAVQLVLAARGVPETTLPKLPAEIEALFNASEPSAPGGSTGQRDTAGGPVGDPGVSRSGATL